LLEFEERKRHLKEGELPRVKKHRLKKNHLKALSFISGLSKPENRCEVVWIEGNHDEGISARCILRRPLSCDGDRG
jgi:hypothetical protein